MPRVVKEQIKFVSQDPTVVKAFDYSTILKKRFYMILHAYRGARGISLCHTGEKVVLIGSFAHTATLPVVLAGQADPLRQGGTANIRLLLGPFVAPALLASGTLTLALFLVGPAVVCVPA